MLYLLYMDMPILVEIPEIWFHELCMLFCIKTLRSKIRKERYKNDHQTPSLLGKQKAIPIFLGVLLLLHGKLSYDTVCGSGRSTDRSVMIQSFTSHAPIGAIVINWSFACSTYWNVDEFYSFESKPTWQTHIHRLRWHIGSSSEIMVYVLSIQLKGD